MKSHTTYKGFVLRVTLLMLSLLSAMFIFAFEAPDSVLVAAHPDRNYYVPRMGKYTGEDFFTALDLPTCFGVSYTPKKIESTSLYMKLCLEWRQHRTYGLFVPINADSHSCIYKDLQLKDHGQLNELNVMSGEVWYYDIMLGLGYRLPIVRDIKEFFIHPYHNRFNFYVSCQPGITLGWVKQVTPRMSVSEMADALLQSLNSITREDLILRLTDAIDDVRYDLEDKHDVVPSVRFTTGFECFVAHNFSLFVEGGYIIHAIPTILEKAYNASHPDKAAPGPLIVSLGFSGFF